MNLSVHKVLTVSFTYRVDEASFLLRCRALFKDGKSIFSSLDIRIPIIPLARSGKFQTLPILMRVRSLLRGVRE